MPKLSKPASLALELVRSLPGGIQGTPDRLPKAIKSQGVRTRLGIMQFWAALFMANEAAAASYGKRREAPPPMTDAEIADKVCQEYPDRKSIARLRDGRITVNWYRNRYNEGHVTMTNSLVPTNTPSESNPYPISHRYDEKGRIVNGKTGKPVAA